MSAEALQSTQEQSVPLVYNSTQIKYLLGEISGSHADSLKMNVFWDVVP
jgi:hypothetical protein